MKTFKLSTYATVELSNVDKKITEGEQMVKLCNFVDVYYNWAVTKVKSIGFMPATASENEIEKFLLNKGDVLLTKDSETRFDIGIPCYVADDLDNIVLGYHCALIRIFSDELSPKYLNALLHTDYARTYFANNASGSGQRYTLGKDAIEDFPIPYIPKNEQDRIGVFLSNIDRKIEVNRKTIALLEVMAKQLYDYWFVQFDFPDADGKPYKLSGGKMVWNEKLKREIPEGWEMKKLSDWLEIKSGYAFKSENYLKDGKYKVITIKNVQDGYLDSSNCDYIDAIPEDIKDCCILNVGDRLMSLTGNCGRVCTVAEDNLLLNQRVGVFCCDKINVEFAYMLLSSDEYRIITDNLSNGAAQANLSPVDICKTEYYYPSEDILLAFNDMAESMRNKIIACYKESARLTSLRDFLLPMLMNGQVTIKA